MKKCIYILLLFCACATQVLADGVVLASEPIEVAKVDTGLVFIPVSTPLPAEIQLGLTKKEIDMGHARALINVDDPTVMIKLYEDIVKNGYSVRKVEELVKALNQQKKESKQPANKELLAVYETMGKQLSALFGSPVKIERNEKGKGRIVLQFANDDELESLLSVMEQMQHKA